MEYNKNSFKKKALKVPRFFTTGDDLAVKVIEKNINSKIAKENIKLKNIEKKAKQSIPPKNIIHKSIQAKINNQKESPRENYAFIDGQNLNKAVKLQGWNLDYKEFRQYLETKYNVKKAYIFIGLITTNQTLYSALQDFGYHLVFKPTIANKFGDVKGNVDTEITLYALTKINQYNKAVIVSGDGDFYSLVQYLQSKGKLEKLLVPNEQAYSALFDTLNIDASFVTDLRKTLEYNKKKKVKHN